LTELHHGNDRLVLRLHLDGVIEGAGDHVGAAADQRLQRPRAAGKIGNLHVEPRVAEVAEALGDSQREIEQRRLAADGEPHPRRFRLCLLAAGEAARGEQQRRGRSSHTSSVHSRESGNPEPRARDWRSGSPLSRGRTDVARIPRNRDTL